MNNKPSLIAFFLSLFIDLYSLYLIVILVLWFVKDEAIFFVDLAINLMPGVFYPLAVSLLIALVLKNWRSIILMLLPVGVFLILYVPHLLPYTVEPIEGQTISLLTYNIQINNEDMASIGDIITRADADIVAIIEANPTVTDWAAEALIDNYPHQVLFTTENSADIYTEQRPTDAAMSPHIGRAILSRYPILSHEVVLSARFTSTYVYAEIEIDSHILDIYTVHLPPPLFTGTRFDTSVRHVELQRLLEDARANSSHSIIMGDFNMSDQTNDYDLIASQYADVYRVTQNGLGTTWINGNLFHPILTPLPAVSRIDYVFAGNAITPRASHVLYRGVSDHYALYADVVINE